MEPAPRRGRSKDRSKDAAVLDATVRLLASHGVAGTSMDRVASAAGVSKVTVYTRWRSKNELVGAALAHLRLGHVPEPTGDVEADLVALLTAMREQYDEVGAMSILGTCLADERGSGGELLGIVREATLLPRRALFAAVLAAGVERGELRADLDVEAATSLVVGTLYADHLAGRTTDPTSAVALALSGWRAAR
ncbi:TetR/AcrR family transcriptional regulator [Actinomycetospora termitidis]|uniref:TetR/AcrR family transcriptional regulator n=1 Tax=Actinomycetospora termitidis TaxID=3053470 RepID=A0ABT7MB58_9PSEU|nr:TetR/AcrR family transcriptional regulator [Actinomycetospora sp. Odt1-22]MDL5157898.1 TetR/AcrR family transcriptional regulator [Actinomycetospora sp. Odt1-22]